MILIFLQKSFHIIVGFGQDNSGGCDSKARIRDQLVYYYFYFTVTPDHLHWYLPATGLNVVHEVATCGSHGWMN